MIAVRDIRARIEQQRETENANAAAAESDRRFRFLIQSVTDYAIYMLDTEGKVANWNAGAQRNKGYTADEIVGQHFSRFFSEDERAAGLPQKALDAAIADGSITLRVGDIARTAVVSGRW